VSRAERRLRPCHALTTGLLLVMVLDARTSPLIAAAGGFGGALIARWLRDLWGTYVWHPAALAAIVVLLGMHYAGPQTAGVSTAAPRPIDRLRQAYEPAGSGLADFRDAAVYELPSWRSTLTGHVAGGVGETCVFAILTGGLWLMPAMLGTKIIAALAPSFSTASNTVSYTGTPSAVCPPLPGVTPATSFVPYSIQFFE